MGNYAGDNTFDVNVYQFEITDQVQGGADGIDNLPLKQLANRTQYLKTQVELKLEKSQNLNDVEDKAQSRANLSVLSADEIADIVDSILDSVLAKSANLSDLDSVSTSRNNLSVYSKAEVGTAQLFTLTAADANTVVTPVYMRYLKVGNLVTVSLKTALSRVGGSPSTSAFTLTANTAIFPYLTSSGRVPCVVQVTGGLKVWYKFQAVITSATTLELYCLDDSGNIENIISTDVVTLNMHFSHLLGA